MAKSSRSELPLTERHNARCDGWGECKASRTKKFGPVGLCHGSRAEIRPKFGHPPSEGPCVHPVEPNRITQFFCGAGVSLGSLDGPLILRQRWQHVESESRHGLLCAQESKSYDASTPPVMKECCPWLTGAMFSLAVEHYLYTISSSLRRHRIFTLARPL